MCSSDLRWELNAHPGQLWTEARSVRFTTRQGGQMLTITEQEALVETVDSRRHGGVGGEDGSGAGQLDGSGKVMPIGQVLADAFETEEPGMALVAVVDIGLGTTGDLAVAAQCPDTTDAKDDLLRETVPIEDRKSVGRERV